MKRLGNVLNEQTVTIELCRKAILDASKNKRRRRAVREVLQDINAAAEELRKIILSGAYEPHSYKPCEIIDKPSGKRRILHKPVFYPDQCLHHACILLVEHEVLKRLEPYCIGSVPGRGQSYGHRAIERWLRNHRKGTKYCAKGDIRHCYDSIKPEVIVKAFEHIFKDKRYLDLITKIAYGHDSLPLGNYTSGWFANIILLAVDRIARAEPSTCHYVRYIDDFIILGSNKRKLHKTIRLIMAAIKEIGLKVKGNWQIFPVRDRGIDMLGYRYYPTHTIMRKRNALTITRQSRKIKKLQMQNKPVPYKMAAGFLSRIGQLKHCNSFNYHQKHLNQINILKLKDVIRGANGHNKHAGKRSKG